MKMKHRSSCAYCGSDDPLTKDHVIPACLYPPSKAKPWVQRVTVRSCLSCSASSPSDERYFRNMMLIAGDSSSAVHELWREGARRGFQSDDGVKQARDLYSAMAPTSCDRHMVFPGQDERVLRVVRTIIRGLCYHHIERRSVADDAVLAAVQKYNIPETLQGEMCHLHAEDDIIQYSFAVLTSQICTPFGYYDFFRGQISSAS